jgi:hypothetical protein
MNELSFTKNMKRGLFLSALMVMALICNWASGQAVTTSLTRIQCPDGMETYVCRALYFDVSPPLAEMAQAAKNVVPGKEFREIENEPSPKYGQNGHFPFLLPEDPVWQKQDGTYMPMTPGPIQNFEGTGNLDGVMPPDTQGDVSLTHYLQVINSRLAVWTKAGAVVLAGTPLSTIWAGIPAPWAGTNDGDPVVLWDQAAQRWVISQFSLPTGNFAELVAISQTPDPTGPWYRYVFQFSTQMPDYPKLGIWPDGYYLSFNQYLNGASYSGTGACALQRDKMLAGDPTAAMVYKMQGTANADPYSMLPSDWDGVTSPPAGAPNYFIYFDDWSSGTTQYLNIWSFHVDWGTTSNSTFAQTYQLTPAGFNSVLCNDASGRGRCVPEPGGSNAAYKLESLSDRLMFRNQYRNFGSYQTMVDCHTVNVGTGVAGCRWYELRNTGGGWTIFQQGTYSPDATYRFMPSIAMNGNGAIALGFSLSNATTQYPSIHYTGRFATDAAGTMTVAEQTIINGTGSQNYSSYGRWGDYSMMSVDPSDDQNFWYTNEYVQTTGNFTWQTRVASFRFNNQPGITTTDPTGISTTGATLNGTINPYGLASTYHFEWGTTLSYGNNTSVISAGSGSSAVPVSAAISGLTPGTTYHFRLDGTNSDGTTYGNDITFIPGAATATTAAATAITDVTATSGGNVLTDGGATVTARGVCWGTSANPTTAGSHTTDGSGLGVFTSSLTGLSANTLYHTRAYATNSAGTWYGNDLTFTTQCGITTIPVNQTFDLTTIPTCWTQVDHQGNGEIWQFGVITGTGAPSLTGNYAYLNSDGYGGGQSQNADLVTPAIDLSLCYTVYLKFSHYFRAYTGSSGTLSYSTDNGATWTQIQQWTASTTNPASFNQLIPGAAGFTHVKFKWNYTGTFGYWWAVDNVVISVTGLWIGGTAGNLTNWNTAGNWDGATLPTGTTDVTIPVRTYLPVINTNGNLCNNLTIGDGGKLTINPGKDLTVNGTLRLFGSGATLMGMNQEPGTQGTEPVGDVLTLAVHGTDFTKQFQVRYIPGNTGEPVAPLQPPDGSSGMKGRLLSVTCENHPELTGDLMFYDEAGEPVLHAVLHPGIQAKFALTGGGRTYTVKLFSGGKTYTGELSLR